MILIARWSSAREPNFDAPDAIFWSDGRPGTLQDYHSHLDDTHALVHCANDSIERRMYPWIVADVRFDGYMLLWFVVAPGQDPISLDLCDVHATDEEITAALYEFPLVYKSRIWR